jgi:hypothetical protein
MRDCFQFCFNFAFNSNLRRYIKVEVLPTKSVQDNAVTTTEAGAYTRPLLSST